MQKGNKQGGFGWRTKDTCLKMVKNLIVTKHNSVVVIETLLHCLCQSLLILDVPRTTRSFYNNSSWSWKSQSLLGLKP